MKKLICAVFLLAVVGFLVAPAMALDREQMGVGQLDVWDDIDLYDSTKSGTQIWGVNGYGNMKKGFGYAVSSPTFTSGTGFDIDEAAGNIFLIDRAIDANAKAESDNMDFGAVGPASSGITVVLSTPTAATDGDVYTFILTDSGTTDAVLYAGGIPMVNASGTTDGCTLDAQGDSISVLADYNSAVSYWLIDYNNN